jgi:D-serine deaminase-like pyridoxal phosphate-dependent protein
MSAPWGEYARLAAEQGTATPQILIDERAVRHNIAHTLALLEQTPWSWRPHVKTARTAWAIGLLLDAGVGRFKASTLGEMAAIASIGGSDALLAIPTSGIRAAALATLADRYPDTRFGALVDDPAQLESWPVGSNLVAMIDLDTGMGRTGVDVSDHGAILNLVEQLAHRSIPFSGLHSYDGHLAAVPARQRQVAVAEQFKRLTDATDALLAYGIAVPELIAGSTHTIVETSAETIGEGLGDDTATRLSVGAGTVIYNDGRSLARFRDDASVELAAYRSAAVLVGTVTSAAGSRVTLDCGTTSVQVDAGTPPAAILEPTGLEFRSLSQEHLVLEFTGPGSVPRVNDAVVLLPRHLDTALSQFTAVTVFGTSNEVFSAEIVGRH